MKPNGKYLFQIIVEQLIEANKKYNITIPYYVMTSRENHEETVAFFETMDYFGYPKQAIKFFKQAEEPLISKDGKLLIGEDRLIKFASNGNGEIYKSLSKNGIIDDMKNKNINWVLVTGIDNILVKIVDPLFIGITIKQGNSIASKSIIKKTPTESGGVFAKANGKPGIIEYVEISEEVANEKDSDGEYVFGDMNIVNHLFKIDALQEIASKPLPYHTAVKKSKFLDENGVLSEGSIYKFEKFIFDGFVYFDEMSLLRVKREEEFAPIKNAIGQDSPKTAKKMYEDYIKTLKK
ncbi:MAG: UTP--glucose-1-phosphate uridylyltransferase [Clostridia bacterium]